MRSESGCAHLVCRARRVTAVPLGRGRIGPPGFSRRLRNATQRATGRDRLGKIDLHRPGLTASAARRPCRRRRPLAAPLPRHSLARGCVSLSLRASARARASVYACVRACVRLNAANSHLSPLPPPLPPPPPPPVSSQGVCARSFLPLTFYHIVLIL